MPRTVVHPMPGAPVGVLTDSSQGAVRPDTLPEKIAKYVPAEVLAFFIPTYALLPEGDIGLRWTVLVIGLIGTVVYLMVSRPADAQPRSFFYVLAAISYLAWAIGTSDAGTELFKLSEAASRVLFAAAVFLVPGVDELIMRAIARREAAGADS